jgi:hypothetical protein
MQREYNETCDGDFLTLGITSSLPCSQLLPVEWTPPEHLSKESHDVSYSVSGTNNCFLLLCLFAIFSFDQLITITLLKAGPSNFIVFIRNNYSIEYTFKSN